VALAMSKSRPITQVAQHCRSCFDFGASLLQSFCGSFIFIFAQQSERPGSGSALCSGCANGPSDAKSARRIASAVTVRIPDLLREIVREGN
jgi:hypothetical protein